MMKHTTTLNLLGVSRQDLCDFLDFVPEEAPLNVVVGHTGVDVPDDYTDMTIELTASWEEKK